MLPSERDDMLPSQRDNMLPVREPVGLPPLPTVCASSVVFGSRNYSLQHSPTGLLFHSPQTSVCVCVGVCVCLSVGCVGCVGCVVWCNVVRRWAVCCLTSDSPGKENDI